MAALYLFSLILGGGFLLFSVLGGGGESDVDVEGGLDLELDAGDVELDALEGDVVDAGTQAEHAASRILSIRTLVYALFGFGATGTALTQMGLSMAATLAFSVVGGLAAGLMVSLVFRFLVRTASGEPPGDASLLGLPGVVTLPLGAGSEGTVVVERDGRRIALRALPHGASPGDPAEWRQVVVVDIEGGVARVSPLKPDELDALGAG